MDHSPLPNKTIDFLEHGAPDGQRNDALKDAVCQIRDARYSKSEAIDTVMPISLHIGLTEREVIATVGSIYSQPPRDPIKANGEGKSSKWGGYTYRPDRRPPPSVPCQPLAKALTAEEKMELPAPIEDGARTLIKLLFKEGEKVRWVKGTKGEDGKEHPRNDGSSLDREQWLKLLDKYEGQPNGFWTCEDGSGIYLGINPTTGPRDDDVKSYRHCLLEWDHLPLESQWGIIKKNRIPCTAVVSTGGRSLHALVPVNAENAEQFKERVAILQTFFKSTGLDPQNKGPSRMTRLPECARNGNVQKLIAVNIGAASFDEWWDEINMPTEITIDEMADFDPIHDPNSLLGQRWLCKMAMAIISGQSGIGKSSLLMQMVVSWALGKDFFGIRPIKPIKSLVVQAENDAGDMSEMFQSVCEKMGYPLKNEEDGTPNIENRDYFRKYIKIYRESSKTGEPFLLSAHKLILKFTPDLVWADPLLTYVGDDVSKQPVVSKFLRNWLNPILEATGVVWMWLHHTPKPPTDAKSRAHWTEKDMAYSSFGSSELVNCPREAMTLYHPCRAPDGVFAFSISKRTGSGMVDYNGKPANTIYLKHCQERRANGAKCIFWERSDWDPKTKKEKPETDESEPGETEETKGAGRPKKFELDPGDFLTRLEGRQLSVSAILDEIISFTGCSLGTAKREWNKKASSIREQLHYDSETKLYSLKP